MFEQQLTAAMFATILMDVYATLTLIIRDDVKQKTNVFRFVPGTA